MTAFISFYHHINEGRRDGKLFHHRWFWHTKLGRFALSIWTGPALRLEFQRGEAGDSGRECSLSVGLFFVTAHFTFPLPERLLLERKCIATWDGNREFYLVEGRKYGFYFYQWAFVWSWHAKVHESSSSDPWWMRQYIHLDELVLGKWESVRQRLVDTEDVWFRLGEKEFKIDRIKWTRSKRFRTFIPFALWHQTRYHVEIKIDRPPMRAGKGENSWDCGDDGTFGLSAPWEGPHPSFLNLEHVTRIAVRMYVEGVLKDAKRYGGTGGERGIRASDQYQYIGRKQAEAS